MRAAHCTNRSRRNPRTSRAPCRFSPRPTVASRDSLTSPRSTRSLPRRLPPLPLLLHIRLPVLPPRLVIVMRRAVQRQVAHRRGPLRIRHDVMKLNEVRLSAPRPVAPLERALSLIPLPHFPPHLRWNRPPLRRRLHLAR